MAARAEGDAWLAKKGIFFLPGLAVRTQDDLRESLKALQKSREEHQKWREEHAEEIKAQELAAAEIERKSAAAFVKFLKSIPIGWWAVALPQHWEELKGDPHLYTEDSLWHKFFATEEEAQRWWVEVYCKKFPFYDVGPNNEPRPLFAEHPEIAEQTYGPCYVEEKYGKGFKIPPPRIVEKLHRVSRERVLQGSQGMYYYLPALKDDGTISPLLQLLDSLSNPWKGDPEGIQQHSASLQASPRRSASQEAATPSKALLVSKQTALQIGLQVEELANAVDAHDLQTVRVMAGRLRANASEHGIDQIAQVAARLEHQSAGSDCDWLELTQLTINPNRAPSLEKRASLRIQAAAG